MGKKETLIKKVSVAVRHPLSAGKRLTKRLLKKPGRAAVVLFSLCTGLSLSHAGIAAEALVAVASNFTAPAKDLAAMFEKATGHKITLSFGSSGKMLAQIVNGAPYDVFMSADQAKPEKLEHDGLAVKGTRFTYALGTLALWTADSGSSAEAILRNDQYQHIAIANPRLAPYGVAAEQVLEHLDLTGSSQPRRVMGENITQTWQFIASGNAEIGFVALSQVMKDGSITSGNAWIIPPEYYQPVKQDAVLLKRAVQNDAATAWLAYLQSENAAVILQRYGYGNFPVTP